MNRVLRLFLSTPVLYILFTAPAIAQNTVPSATSASVPYDLSKEIKIQGTIQTIETAGANGPAGMHILVQTSQGVVDAQLGFGSAVAAGNLGVSEGQSVTVVGMMQTLDGNSVMLARVLTTPSRVFVLRTEHGIPVRSVPSGNFRTASTLKGAL
jgi:hypothetical protein